MGVAFASVLERVANLFATPFASEPFSCQEQKKNSAEADAFVHAIWRGALLPVDLIVDEPLSAAPCVALLGGGMHVDDDWRLLVNRGVCLTTGPFIPGRSGHAAVVEYECGRSWQSAEAAEHLPYRCDQHRIHI
jgi:hypothetical protein